MAIQSAAFRALLITVALALIALIASACGRGGASITPKLLAQPAYVNMDEALAELDALQPPEGVDAGLFQELKDSFRGMLLARGKIALAPSSYAVNDMKIIPGAPGVMPRITWSSDFFIADGNIDGAVAISDVTPIAMWFGQSVVSAPRAKVADYNRDGTVSISELTQLAMTFGQRVADFKIEAGPAATGPFTQLALKPWGEQLPDKNIDGFAVFEYEMTIADFAGGAGSWLRLVPRDESGVDGVPCEARFVVFPNTEPTAVLAGNPTSGQVPLEVFFDASGSSDPDGTIATYDYDWESDGTYDLLDGGATPSHVYDVEGNYTATLLVTDNIGATATATLPIAVGPGANQPPIAVLTADITNGIAPLLVNFDAGGSYDPDNNVPPNNGIQQYEWDWDGDGVYDLTSVTPTAPYVFDTPSAVPYAVTVRVTDSEGATATDYVLVTVTPAGVAPFIESITPTQGVEGTEVTFTATVSGTQPFDYSFDFTSPVSWATPDYVEGSGSVVEATVTLGAPGTYTLTVTASNAYGGHQVGFSFEVLPAGDPPIILNITPEFGDEGAEVTITANVTGTTPFDYFFDFDSVGENWATPNYVAGTADVPSATVTLGAPGIHTLTVYASNAYGSHQLDFQFEVLALTYPPVIESISPSSGLESTEVTIVATVSGATPFDYSFDFDSAGDSWATPNFVSGTGDSPSATVTLGSTPGTYTLTVSATNSYGSDSQDFLFQIQSSGTEWSIYPVITNGVSYNSLAVVGSNPGISYFGGSDDLFYAYCSTADGTGSWSSVTVDSKGMGMGDVGAYCSLVETGSGPSISYYEGGIDGDLRFAHNASTDGSGTWSLYDVDDTGDSGVYTSVEDVNGYPAIGYFTQDTAWEYRFSINDASDGSGTWSTSIVDTVNSVMFADGRVLRVLDGRPAAAFYNWNDDELQFAINSDAYGGGTWTSSLVDNTGIILFPSMAVVNSGKPAIAYRNWSVGKVSFAINSAADGSGTWSVYDVDTTSTPQFISVSEVGGYPAIAYVNINADKLLYAICATADGSGTWSITTVDTGSSILYANLLEVDGRACVAYSRTSTGQLCFARRNW